MTAAAAGATADDQGATLAFLAAPEAHGGAAPIRRVDTHISAVFLAGDRALKLKRAVSLGYVDFSTLARRRAAVAAELAVNRRTAPALYLGAAPVRRAASLRLALGPVVEPAGMATDDPAIVDWVVVMRRFDEATLFDRLAATGALTPDLAARAAEAVAAFHAGARRVPAADGAARALGVIAGNEASVRRAAVPRPLAPARAEALAAAARAEHARQAAMLDARAANGFVRDGHGDLHLGNLCLVDGAPTLFDAIEFDPALREIDIAYDAAFLFMDLAVRASPAAANAAFNAYLGASGDAGGIALLPLFQSLRAVIRGHVRATQAAARAGSAVEAGFAESKAYFDFAARALAPPPPPRLIAIGGLSGTGKSTVAAGLAPGLGHPPGAVILRSDVIRKAQAGVAPAVRLAADHYSPARTAAVYAEMLERAGRALAAGASCVVDAVSGSAAHRLALAALAVRHGAGFAGVWLEAPTAVRLARVSARHGDASDATADVAAAQREPEALDWPRVDATGSAADVLARVATVLG